MAIIQIVNIENVSQCPYYVFYNSGWKQCFVIDEESLGAKYDLVNMMGMLVLEFGH